MNIDIKQTKEIKRLTTVFLFRYFRILIVLVVLLLLFLGNNYVIKPKRADIALNQKDAIEDREAEKEKLLKYLDDLKKYRLEYEKIPLASRERIKTFLPEEAYKENLFLELENIFKAYGISPASISIAGEEVDQVQSSRSKTKTQASASGLPKEIGVLRIKVDLGLEIDYQKMKDVLSAIEKNLRLMDLDSLDYSNNSGSMSLSIKTYYIKS